MVEAAPEFFDSYAEPHRRRPSTVDFPAASYLISLWHPRRFQETFAPYMRAVLSCFVGKMPLWTREPFTEATAQALGDRLFRIYDFRSPERRNERLVFDFLDNRHAGLTWRLEVHREFVTVVAFVSMHLETNAGTLKITALKPAGPDGTTGFEQSVSLLQATGRKKDSVTDRLFDGQSDATGLEAHVAALFQPLLQAINRFSDDVRLTNGDRLTGELRPTYFAKFFGCVLPWTVFAGHDGGPDTRPWFPELNALGRRSDEARGQGETARFMDCIWPDLCGDFLNSDRLQAGDPPGRDEGDQSCVACYLQNGHAFYISSLGARRDESDRSALHYLVLYQDHPEWHALHGPSARRSSDPALGISGRLSRLTGRLHDIGVARLAALKQVGNLKNFAQYLSHVESELQRYNPRKVSEEGGRQPLTFEAIERLRSEMFSRAEAFEESVVNRSLRAGTYFDTVKTLAQDLGIVGIPRWQTYDLFIRRRLFGTLTEVSAVSDRYQAVLKVFNTIYQMRTSEETKVLAAGISRSSERSKTLMAKLKQLQVGAGIVAGVLLFYYLSDVASRMVLARVAPQWLINVMPPLYWVASISIVGAMLFTLVSMFRGDRSVADTHDEK